MPPKDYYGEIYLSIHSKEWLIGHGHIFVAAYAYPEIFLAPIKCKKKGSSYTYYKNDSIIIFDYMIKEIHTLEYIEEKYPQVLI